MLKSKDFIQTLEKMCNTMEFPFDELCKKCGFSLPLFLNNEIEVLASHKMLAAEVLNLPVGMVAIAADAHNPDFLGDWVEKRRKFLFYSFDMDVKSAREKYKREMEEMGTEQEELQKYLDKFDESHESAKRTAEILIKRFTESFPLTNESLAHMEKDIYRVLNEDNDDNEGINALFWDKYDEMEDEKLEKFVDNYDLRSFPVRYAIILRDMVKVQKVFAEIDATLHKDQSSATKSLSQNIKSFFGIGKNS